MVVPRRIPESADALGALHLVGREGDEVRAQGPHVDGQVGGTLHGIDVDECRRHRPHAGDEFRQRLDGAHLVVGQLQAHQDGPVRQGRRQVVRVESAVAVDCQAAHVEAELLQQQAGLQDGLVLHRGGEDAVTGRLARPRGTLDGQVDGFRPAAREDDAARLRADAAGESLMGLVQPSAGLPPGRVRRRGIGAVTLQDGQHLRQHLRAQRRRGSMVQVHGHAADCRRGPRRPRRGPSTAPRGPPRGPGATLSTVLSGCRRPRAERPVAGPRHGRARGDARGATGCACASGSRGA